MPHGQPDFGMYAVKETVGSLADMAELAARLKSIVTLDRRGDVIFLEDFEDPILKWTGSGSGADDEQRLYPGKAFMGSQCVYLVTSALTDAYSFIVHRFNATRNQSYGIEAKLQYALLEAYYDVEMWVYTGEVVYKGEWRYDMPGKRLLIWDSTGHWKEKATGIEVGLIYQEWFPMKLVVDSLTAKYVRGLFMGVEYDLSDELMEEAEAEDVAPCISPAVEVITPSNNQAGAYFDNLIITQNEP